MKPSWIVFDIGGVILDWRCCRQATIEKLNVTLGEFNLVFLKYLPDMESGLITPIQGFKSILDDLKILEEPAKIFEFWQSNLKPIIPTTDLIKKLSKTYNLAICSNTWTDVLRSNISCFPEIFSNFNIFVDSSIEKTTKPSIEIYKIVETKIGISGQNIFFIDDSQKNLDVAKLFDWQTYLFNLSIDSGKQSCQEIAKILL